MLKVLYLRKKNRLKGFFKFLFYSFLIAFSIGLSYIIYYISDAIQNVPDIRQLETFKPRQVIQVFDYKGRLITEFYYQRRKYVPIDKIPKIVREAFISIEDKSFYSNNGIDFEGIVRAAIKNISTGKIVAGGSTISQQLVKNLFLTPKKSFKRKIKEMYLAIKLNKTYPKDKILEMYLNYIYLGHGAYGVEAASKVYFGKHVWELDVCEAATLAGLPKAPSKYDPYKNIKLATYRRNLVLDRMVEEGYISPEQAKACKNTPIKLVGKGKGVKRYDDYFTEEVKKWFIKNFGLDAFYKGGYKIYTTVDIELQKKAIKLAQKHLEKLQETVGFPKLTAIEKSKLLKLYREEKDLKELKKNRIYVAIIESVDYKNHLIKFKIYDTGGEVYFKGNLTNAKKGVPFYVEYLGNNKFKFVPFLETAIISIYPKTGAVRILVGGYSFKKSKFNRVIQTRRQPGSAFKPIVYATAIKRGYTQISYVYDEPIGYWDIASGKIWTPKNYDKKYRGKVILRYALAHSLNAAAVNLYHNVGKKNVVRLAHLLGIKTKLYPVPSLALGSYSIKPIELATVYSTFANQGKRCTPYLVEEVRDFTGGKIYLHEPTCYQVYPQPENAVMVDLLKGVVQEGTGRRALVLGFPVAGKTGTTNEYSDAWFAGFSTQLTTVVWVGYDVKKKIGEKMTGSRAALPLWIKIMDISHPYKNKVPDFQLPEGASYYTINMTYLVLATPACPFNNKNLVFVKGTQPDITCSDVYLRRKKSEEKSVEELEKEIENFELQNENGNTQPTTNGNGNSVNEGEGIKPQTNENNPAPTNTNKIENQMNNNQGN